MIFRCTKILTAVFLLLLVLGAGAGLCALDPETAYQKVKGKYLSLQSSAKKQLYRENWLDVIEGFVGVAQNWPTHRRAPDALYMAGKTARGLYQVSRLRDDAELALRYFNRIVVEYPDDSLADDALFQAGETLQKDLKDMAGAYRQFSRVVREYPRGDMFSLAKPRLQALAKKVPKEARREREAVQNRQLKNIREWSDAKRTRIVFDFNGKVTYEVHQLPASVDDGPKIFFDIPDAGQASELATPVLFDHGLVERVRTGRPSADVLRVVLDLRRSVRQRVFALEEPFRIVADLTPGSGMDDAVPSASSPKQGGAQDELARILEQHKDEAVPNLHIPEKKKGRGLRRIVVDAGHGGKDPGAIGARGTREKDVTLALAKKLARHLRSTLGCEVILTRDRDVFIPLEERTAIANRLDADLFISLHANASRNRKAYGIETYYLNFSKNKAAVEVAARENDTSLEEVGDLELILFDLMANAKINESSRLATEIQGALVGRLKRSYSRVRNLGVRPGPFYVLLGATMPSVLVETAFISNPTEESRLKNSSYQDRTARAIAEGVHRYARALNLLASNR
ncbi:MAG: N-acetylmuramoyl-L-alanine amidase [Deltaproteobacteria bacterium]|nr:MAG: N-acetylmuramoyl-L-alanine amidase [Deltaproteobacteria bacterium]